MENSKKILQQTILYKNKLLPKIAVGLIYILLSLIIGEQHPFTMMPMYNSFNNFAYSFKLTDAEGGIIPLTKYFRLNSGDLGHKYAAVGGALKLQCWDQKETPEDLKKIGTVLMTDLMNSKQAEPQADSVQLHLVSYYRQGDSILKNERLMYEAAVKK